jgi:hypothetical protein
MIPLRIISFIGVALCALFLPVWVFVCVAPLYAFVFSPYELLVLSVCIDAQFGEVGRGVWYLYTAITAVVTLLAMSMRPFLRFYA